MTVGELITELSKVDNLDTEVRAYINIDDVGEFLYEIVDIDNTITDRVDLNLGYGEYA